MGVSGGPDMIQDGLVLAVDAADRNSYPGSGTVWNDVSGNNYVGSLVNTPTFNSANRGSFTFNGTNQYTTTTYSQPAYGTGTSFTWNIWVNLPDSVNPNSPIIGNRTANSSGNWAKLTKVAFEYYTTIFAYVMPLNVWQNICFVKNGTTLTYYQNGNSVASTVSSVTQTSQPFYIGGDNTASEYFAGSVANVQVYNRALSATEIAQNYNSLKSRFGLI